ncbi:MAG: hypothetical protein ACREPN_11890 [Rudaea sp.]
MLSKALASLSVAASLVTTIPALGTDGYFDASWTGGGHITLSPWSAGPQNTGDALLIQPDGKMLIAGNRYASNSGPFVFCLTRLTADAGYDYSFGPNGDGRVCLDQFAALAAYPSQHFLGHGMALQADGKIVLAGSIGNDLGTTDALVLRLNPDGTLDTSAADGAGYVSFQFATDAGADFSAAVDVALQSDGKIVVAGTGYREACPPSCNEDMGVARFDGSLHPDSTFKSNGKRLVAFDLGSDMDDEAYRVIVQPSGKILIAGFADNTVFEAAVARLDADGSDDTSFGDSGQGRFHFAIKHAVTIAYAMAVDANGKILLAGENDTGTAPDIRMMVARLLADGSAFDTAFDGISGGVFGTPAGTGLLDFSGLVAGAGNNDSARDIAIQSDGRIVLVGVIGTTSSTDLFGEARLNPDDGSYDNNFAVAGRDYGWFGVAGDYIALASAIAFAPGNHMMVVGSELATTTSNAQIGIGRLTTDLIFCGPFEPPTNQSNP